MFQLNIRHFLERSRLYFKNKEIISRDKNGFYRYNYSLLYERVSRLANALLDILHVKRGDRIASICWNTHRHFELHLAVPSIGAILHTVNARFNEEEIIYCINKAKDKIIFLDYDFYPLISKIRKELKTIEKIVITNEKNNELNYEDLLSMGSSKFDFPDIEENAPAIICFTTGTTGKSKGVVYTHRGIFLRSLASCLADTYAISEKDTILHMVPMYHISSWFMPYAATLVGAKQVFPGPRPSSELIYELIRNEAITVSDGVPTIWIDFLDYMKKEGRKEDIKSLKKLIIGGSAPPKALIKEFKKTYDIDVIHAWGMTETYDSAVASMLKSYMERLDEDKRLEIISKQGIPFPAIEVNAINENNKPIVWNGIEKGELIIRGAWVVNEYYEDVEETQKRFFGEWLRTGDMVTIDEEGYIEVIDRVKDIIRSGGETISSIMLENELMAHPAVKEATVIAIPHEKWGERPLACIVLKDEYKNRVKKEEIIEMLAKKFPKWWLPEDIVFLDSIPKTSVGKFDKKTLRKMFEKYQYRKD